MFVEESIISSFQVEISVAHIDGGKKTSKQNECLHLAHWMGMVVLSCIATELKIPSSLLKSGLG